MKVTASDSGGGTADATFGIVVSAVSNAAPTATNGTVTTDEDTAYAFQVSDFNFSDTDTGDALESVKVTSLPDNGELRLNGSAIATGSLPQEVTAA